ncbi:glycosyltransferase family 2 protein [Sphingomonas crusticola]|uniref:glycosyltransferase family 2 protein n=1 Tax=Sphingomonas crusticola TaxID=1697973 RepID=UPI000E282680|nr:glycosyltransferase [Sphingomonas crusticola]
MKQPSIAVAIATAGRRETLTDILGELGSQQRLPDRIAVCPARPEDADRNALERLPFLVEMVSSPIGLCAQRNALLHMLSDVDIVLMLDDDFVMDRYYVAECVDLFARHDDVVMMTGEVIADGILGPGLELAEARAALAKDRMPEAEALRAVHNGYGCNMAFRMAPVRAHALLFDERLPLYAWLEDVDFSRRLAPYGRIVKSQRCRGVHMGVKRGRSPGLRLGYSQVANPYYMWRKGSLSARFASIQTARNLAANFSRMLRPEPWVDRGGRVRGNLLAMGDLVRGRIDPQRARELG